MSHGQTANSTFRHVSEPSPEENRLVHQWLHKESNGKRKPRHDISGAQALEPARGKHPALWREDGGIVEGASQT